MCLKLFPSRSATDRTSPKDEELPPVKVIDTMAHHHLAGKVALITGASKGIGKALALRLAKDGARVVVNYSSDSKAADDVVKSIGGDHAIAVKADAGNIADIDRLVKETVQRFGKIDILVANAGALPHRNLEATTERDFDSLFTLNVKGPYFLCQKAVPHMAPGSHIVTISTSLNHASGVTPNYLLYCSTKGAIEQMTRVMAKGLAAKGISVNCVAPGPVDTDLFHAGVPEPVLKVVKSINPYGRIGNPEEIADAIAFYCGDDSRWITGQVVKVNGGTTVG